MECKREMERPEVLCSKHSEEGGAIPFRLQKSKETPRTFKETAPQNRVKEANPSMTEKRRGGGSFKTGQSG